MAICKEYRSSFYAHEYPRSEREDRLHRNLETSILSVLSPEKNRLRSILKYKTQKTFGHDFE